MNLLRQGWESDKSFSQPSHSVEARMGNTLAHGARVLHADGGKETHGHGVVKFLACSSETGSAMLGVGPSLAHSQEGKRR